MTDRVCKIDDCGKIEITPEMLEAGIFAACFELDLRNDPAGEIVEHILKAALEAAPQCQTSGA